MITLTIYSRPGCHLCEEMKGVVWRVARAEPGTVSVREVDISNDVELESRYGLEVPVLLADGRKIAKYRVTEDEVRRALAGRVA